MTDDQAATGTRQQWRKLPYDVGPSDLHFRQSDALVRLSQQPTLWWHSTERPTLILGAGQARFDLSRCEAAGVLAVRRHAGGTAVYADAGVVGLDVMLPTGHPLALPDVVQTYRRFGEIWNGCLRSMGISAHLVSVAEARAASDPLPADAHIRMACFGTLSPYEVTANGRKLVGLAQIRRRNGVLVQSAIHKRFDAERLAGLLGVEDLVPALRRAAIGLDELGDFTVEDVMGNLEATLESELCVTLQAGSWTQDERSYVDSTQ